MDRYGDSQPTLPKPDRLLDASELLQAAGSIRFQHRAGLADQPLLRAGCAGCAKKSPGAIPSLHRNRAFALAQGHGHRVLAGGLGMVQQPFGEAGFGALDQQPERGLGLAAVRHGQVQHHVAHGLRQAGNPGLELVGGHLDQLGIGFGRASISDGSGAARMTDRSSTDLRKPTAGAPPAVLDQPKPTRPHTRYHCSSGGSACRLRKCSPAATMTRCVGIGNDLSQDMGPTVTPCRRLDLELAQKVGVIPQRLCLT